MPNAANRDDRRNSRPVYARPMMAEVVVDVLNDALGASEDFGPDAPPESRAIEIATNRVTSPDVARVFRVFGRPGRTATCDCERPTAPALPQTLFLMTDPALLQKVTGGRLRALLAGTRVAMRRLIDELFLATLSRFPDAREKPGRAGPDHGRGHAHERLRGRALGADQHARICAESLTWLAATRSRSGGFAIRSRIAEPESARSDATAATSSASAPPACSG